MRLREVGIRGWRPTAKGELVTGMIGGDVDITGKGAAVISLTGTLGDGMSGVGGRDGSEGCALPWGMIHSSGLKLAV